MHLQALKTSHFVVNPFVNITITAVLITTIITLMIRNTDTTILKTIVSNVIITDIQLLRFQSAPIWMAVNGPAFRINTIKFKKSLLIRVHGSFQNDFGILFGYIFFWLV